MNASARPSPVALLAALALVLLTLLVASAAGSPDLSTGREANYQKELSQ